MQYWTMELIYLHEYSSQFVQYVADNVDHNIRTLDGNNTFHGMGMIAAITPGVSKSKTIPRVNVTPKDIAAIGVFLSILSKKIVLVQLW